MRKEEPQNEVTQEQKEDFWLEIGPAGAYSGLECYGTAVQNGDASPDAQRLGWPGAEPGKPAAPDDVPPIDR